MKCTCPEPGCPAPEYSPAGGGHHRGGAYGGCCQTFANERTGERHRVGPHNPPGQRRCLEPAEMEAKGWRLTPRGWDSSPPLSAGARAALGAKGAVDAP